MLKKIMILIMLVVCFIGLYALCFSYDNFWKYSQELSKCEDIPQNDIFNPNATKLPNMNCSSYGTLIGVEVIHYNRGNCGSYWGWENPTCESCNSKKRIRTTVAECNKCPQREMVNNDCVLKE